MNFKLFRILFWRIFHGDLRLIFRRIHNYLPKKTPTRVSREALRLGQVIGVQGSARGRAREKSAILLTAMANAFEEGRYENYVSLGKERGELQDEQAEESNLLSGGLRILGNGFFGPMGHIAHLELYLKSLQLKESGFRKVKVVVEPSRIPNPTYLSLWSDLVETSIVRRSGWVDVEYLLQPITERADFIRMKNGYEHYLTAWDRVNRLWDSQQREPLLRIPPDLLERGMSNLRRLGISEDSWYVCFHIREGDHRVSNRGANAIPDSYLSAMREVVQRGGVAIRMGHRGMTPLMGQKGIIDYAHSPQRSDWMDVFLWATCKFFVATGSGPSHVPPTFGVPVLLTNAAAIGIITPYSRGGLMITKHFHDSTTKRELSLAEALERRVGWNWSADFSRQGVEVRDNTPEELRDAVVDMFTGAYSLTAAQRALDEQRRTAGSAITTPFAPTFAETMITR